MDIRVDKRVSACFITWNDGGEKNGTCAGGAATDWKRGVQVRFVNIFMGVWWRVYNICVGPEGAENMQIT